MLQHQGTSDPYYVSIFYELGPLAAPIGVEGNAFLDTKYGNSSWPDIQITSVSAHPGFDGGTVYKDFLGISEEVTNFFFELYSIYNILI